MPQTDVTLNAAIAYDLSQIDRATEMAARRAQGVLGSYTNNFKQFQQSIDAATSRVTAFGLTVGIFVGIKQAITSVVKSTIEMEKGLTDINIVLNLSSRNLRIFSEDLIKVAGNTGKTFDEATKAATEFSRQGLGVQETLKRTRDALNLSRLSGIDTMEAVTDLTAAMNSFNDSVLDSTQLVSKFAAVDQRFAVSSRDLAEAIKRVGSVAQGAGVNINQLIGLVTALQERTGRGGATIGTALNRILTRIQQPQGLDELASFGIKVREDVTRNVLPAIDILNNLSKAITNVGQLSQGERTRIIQQIGSLYQINQLISLLQDLKSGSTSTAAQAAGIASGASIESLEKSAQLNQTLFAQINRTAQNFKLTFSRIGESGGGNLKQILDPLNTFLEMFNKTDKVEGLGKRLAQGLFKGIADFIIGPGGLGLVYIINTLAMSAFAKVGDAIKSFTQVQIVLRKQLETLREEAIETSKINALNQQRLQIEREILATLSGRIGGSGKGRSAKGSQAEIIIGRTAEFIGTESPLPTSIYAATGRMGYLSRRINQIGSMMGSVDPQMTRLMAEERAIAQVERETIRRNLNALRIDELTPRASQIFGGGLARTALGNINPILLNQINQGRMNRLQNGAFGISLGGPILANMIGSTAFSGEGRGNRMGRDISSGIGNIAGGIGLGAIIGTSGGNPFIGGIIGGAIAGLAELYKILKSIGDVMPEVNASLSSLREKISMGENMYMLASQLTERSAGFISGDIKQTSENISNFRSQMGSLIGQVSGAGAKVDLNQFAQDIKSGDPSKLEKYRNILIPEQLFRSTSAEKFIEKFAGTSDLNDIFTNAMGLQSRSGKSMMEVLQYRTSQRSLSEIQFPSIKLGPGMDEAERIPGNFNGLIPIMAQFLTQDQMTRFLSLIKSDPAKAQQFAQRLINQLKTNKGIPSRTSLLSGNIGTALDLNPPVSTANVGINRSPELELADILSQMDFRSNRMMESLSIGEATKSARFSRLQAANAAAIQLAEMNQTPLQIAGLRRQLGMGEIGSQFALSKQLLNAETVGSLFGGVKTLQSGLDTTFRQNSFGAGTRFLQSMTEQVGAGEPGSIKGFNEALELFKFSVKKIDEQLFKKLSPTIDNLVESISKHNTEERKLAIAEEAQRNVLDLSTDAMKMMIEGKSMLDLNLFRVGTAEEADRLKFFKSQNAIFSDEFATGTLQSDLNLIKTGELSNKQISGATIKGFSNQLEFNAIDVLKDIRIAGDALGESLKSSFKDAFRTFLDGSQSASDALRSLGLSFANKILDIAAQGTTNLLFGGLQNLGSAAWAGLSRGATGGFVKGGSGIRDDVPAMLNEGSFVIRKSSVNKYGTGFLNAINFANGGGVNFSPSSPLSNFALSDENNPQNRIRMEQEANDLNALMQYMAAKHAFETAKRQRRLGAVINLGAALAGAGLGATFGGRGSGIAGGPTEYNQGFPEGYSPTNGFMGGFITHRGVQRFAGGGSVDNVPALLTGGEYVMNKQAVSRHGVGLMSALNRGEIPRFNTGGFVGETIEGGESGKDKGLNDSISRLINSQERLRTTLEKSGVKESDGSMSISPLVGSISINVAMGNDGNVKTDVQTDRLSKEESRANRGTEFAELIKATVVETIVKHSRNGGLLEQTFQRRRAS